MERAALLLIALATVYLGIIVIKCQLCWCITEQTSRLYRPSGKSAAVPEVKSSDPMDGVRLALRN